jgi:hypothetical protein
MSIPIHIPNSHQNHNEFAYSYNPYESPIYNYPNRFQSHSCPVPTTGTSPICPDKRMNVLQLISPNDRETSPLKPFLDTRQDKTKLPRELLSELIRVSSSTPTSFTCEKNAGNTIAPTSFTCEKNAGNTIATTSSMDEYMIAYISSSESDESISNANIHQTDEPDIFPMEEQERNEDWPFTDQTFEDIALYLWKKQEQDDMKEKVF